MGILSNESSKKTYTTVTDITNQNATLQGVSGTNLIYGNGVSVLDGGAIPLAATVSGYMYDVAMSGADRAHVITSEALAMNERSSMGALDFVENMTESEASENMRAMIRYAGYALIASAVFYGYKKGMFK